MMSSKYFHFKSKRTYPKILAHQLLLRTGITACVHSTVKNALYHTYLSKIFTNGKTIMFSKTSLGECPLTTNYYPTKPSLTLFPYAK